MSAYERGGLAHDYFNGYLPGDSRAAAVVWTPSYWPRGGAVGEGERRTQGGKERPDREVDGFCDPGVDEVDVGVGVVDAGVDRTSQASGFVMPWRRRLRAETGISQVENVAARLDAAVDRLEAVYDKLEPLIVEAVQASKDRRDDA